MSLEPRYFTRMAAALDDKLRILDWVLPGQVVDVGAGGGELTHALAQLDGVTATATDFAPESLDRLRRDTTFATVEGRAGDGAPLVADTVVFNAVLHEVYSYMGHDAWLSALDEAATAKRVIIRDGVMPVSPLTPARFRSGEEALVREYLRLTPHPLLELSFENGWWTGSRHAVSEALLTVTWGWGSLPRESQERFQLSGKRRYTALMSQRGFTLRHFERYVQPGYVTNLAEYEVESLGAPWFPDTNALWVFDRVSEAEPRTH